MDKALKKGGIGLIGATTLGVVMLSPAMTLYGGFGPAYLNAGAAAPLAFVWALLATLPTACSYILLSREHPVSGSAASWAELAFPKRVAMWAGWMVFLYYLTNFIIQPVTLGVFAGDLFQLIHVNPDFFTYAVGAVICLVWAASFVYRGLSISSHGALGFLLFESAVVTILCITVIVSAKHGGASFSTAGFHLTSSPTGSSGIFRAMVFAMLAYCGFDVVSTLAEETDMPKKIIPKATLLSLIVFALIIIVGIWTLTYGGSTEDLRKAAEAGQMPISEIAKKAWGRGGILIPITGISAALGLTIATAIGASRVLHSMSRSGVAPQAFSVMNESRTPRNALHLIFGLGFVASILTGALIGPFQAYVWWGTTSTFFAMITYLFVNGANLTLNYRRAFAGGVGPIFGYLLVPMIGLAVDGYLLYRTFFYELWQQGWATGQSVVLFDLLCGTVALVAVVGMGSGLVVRQEALEKR